MLARCSRLSLGNVCKTLHGNRGHRLQTTQKTVSIAIGFILTVGLLMRLFVGFPEKASKLQIPLFLRSDTDIWSASLPLRHDPEWRAWLTQSGIHVSAIVFYGRRAFVRVLDAYLKRNLVSAGGLLEEVVWVVRTDDQQDLDWLDHTPLPSEASYRKVVPTGVLEYAHAPFDDDIMYIKDGAVDDMLHEKLKKRFWIISANVINHSVLSWVHAGMGAMQVRKHALGGLNMGDIAEQRMLPFLEAEPFADIKYGAYESACALHSPDCAALSHLNFLQNIADNNTAHYDFGVWDFNAFNYARWSINTIMFKGSDLCRENLGTEDEADITQTLPQGKGRRSGAVGSAVVGHLAYNTQRSAGLLDRVDLVEQYADLAANLTGALLDE